MKMYVGVTDRSWFDFLAANMPDEVNFWRPNATQTFRAIEPGAPFLFKLHSPERYIVGGGFFVSHSVLPLSLAWQTFGPKNGAPNPATLERQIRKYREGTSARHPDPMIGCIILTSPFFFEQDIWIPQPSDWSPNLVQGRTYDTSNPIGAALWQEVQRRLHRATVPESVQVNEHAGYGAAFLTHARLGQGAFRVLVTDAYTRRCAMTGERTLPVLQAGHIKPSAQRGPNRVNNGLLLRADLHILFDRGYLTVTPEHRIVVSSRIKEEFENGRDYYALHGHPLTVVPRQAHQLPAPDLLDWHNQHVFVQ